MGLGFLMRRRVSCGFRVSHAVAGYVLRWRVAFIVFIVFIVIMVLLRKFIVFIVFIVFL